jgi:hypothetical protein
MHLTLKKEATRPPGLNSLQQQAKFDAFVREFNAERPHEALAMRCPAELYTASPRSYDGLPELQYPWHDRDIDMPRLLSLWKQGRLKLDVASARRQRRGCV